MLISVYRGLSSFSVFGDERGTVNGDGSGAASGVVMADVMELRSQKGSTWEVTTSVHILPVSIASKLMLVVGLMLVNGGTGVA